MKPHSQPPLSDHETECLAAFDEGMALARTLVRQLRCCQTSDTARQVLAAALADLVPAPAWNELDATLARLEGFVGLLIAMPPFIHISTEADHVR